MKLTIKDKKTNSFLGRVEVVGHLEFEAATPSNKEVIDAITNELKVSSDVVVLNGIHTNFSSHNAEVKAYVYASPEARKKVEPVTAHMKKAAGAKKEEKKEEKK